MHNNPILLEQMLSLVTFAYKVAVFMEWMPRLDGVPGRRRRDVHGELQPVAIESGRVSIVLNLIEEAARVWDPASHTY